MTDQQRPARSIWKADGLDAQMLAIPSRDWKFRASDGYELAVLSWLAPGDAQRGQVLLLHGVQSHAGWYHALGRRLAAAGYSGHFPDRRGSGINTHDRGHAPSARRLIDDTVELAQAVRREGGAPLHLVGISWGAKIAVAAAASHPELFNSLVLLAPGLHPRVGVSLREKIGVAFALLTGHARQARFAIPLADPALFTNNLDAQAFLRGDPLSLRLASAGLMFASRVIDRAVARSHSRLTMPLLLVLAEHDRIVDNRRTMTYFDKIPGGNKTLFTLAGATHTPEFGPDSGQYAHMIVKWLDSSIRLASADAVRTHASPLEAGRVDYK